MILVENVLLSLSAMDDPGRECAFITQQWMILVENVLLSLSAMDDPGRECAFITVSNG